jgi:ADP-ribose diphosphatase
MAQWDDRECLARYRRLENLRPELFATRATGAYRILTDGPMIERAKADAAELRASQATTYEDTRVGVVADGPYVIALREAVEFPDGLFGLYNRFVVPSGIVVLPVLHSEIVVLYRYRYGTRSWQYEFPRGFVEVGEKLEDAVERELVEEIGASANEIIPMGSIHSSSGITNEYSDSFLAQLSSIGAPDRHEAVLRIELLGRHDFRRKVAAGEITDGPTLAAYAQAAAPSLLK